MASFVPVRLIQGRLLARTGPHRAGLMMSVLTLLGFLTANLIGRTLVDLGERILGRIPA